MISDQIYFKKRRILIMNWIIHYIIDQYGPYKYLINSHTHGMELYNHLDFQVVLDLPPEHISHLLNTMGKRVKSGETFCDGDMVSGLYTECDILLKQYRETGRDVLRLIIPDKKKCYPDDADCMEPYKYQILSMFE